MDRSCWLILLWGRCVSHKNVTIFAPSPQAIHDMLLRPNNRLLTLTGTAGLDKRSPWSIYQDCLDRMMTGASPVRVDDANLSAQLPLFLRDKSEARQTPFTGKCLIRQRQALMEPTTRSAISVSSPPSSSGSATLMDYARSQSPS
jgi:hypothetical protein